MKGFQVYFPQSQDVGTKSTVQAAIVRAANAWQAKHVLHKHLHGRLNSTSSRNSECCNLSKLLGRDLLALEYDIHEPKPDFKPGSLLQAAGLATMIAAMRPDIDNIDEYVRNTTARAFSVVASALGIPALLPFLKAVCQSKKSWQARHTGIKIVQQISILMGCAVLPHLKVTPLIISALLLCVLSPDADFLGN